MRRILVVALVGVAVLTGLPAAATVDDALYADEVTIVGAGGPMEFNGRRYGGTFSVRVVGDRVVLTDFGISSHKDVAEIFGDEAIGTPSYMAPEQVRGDWRDQGPCTDLYAVGAMAWALCTGRTPTDPSDLETGEVPEALADWLVRALNMPFRDAHHVTGSLVAMAEGKGCDLPDLTLEEMQSVHEAITADVFDVLGVHNSVASRTSYGGTAPSEVRKQIARWQEKLA